MNNKTTNKAVFLDRDGNMIEDVGYLTDPGQLRLYSWTAPALRRLQQAYKLFVVTNQSGVASGELTMEQVDRVNQALNAQLAQQGVTIEAWYVCPHTRAQGCDCIKPKPYFLEKAAADYHLDLRRSFSIGDHGHDVATAEAVGGFGLYVLTGHGGRGLQALPSDKLVFHNLADAADWILAHPNPEGDLRAAVAAGAEAIRAGKLTAFPTETVYGLGADAFNPVAIADIFRVKQRPLDDPLIIHLADPAQVADLASSVPEIAKKLMAALWPGPLSLVLPKSERVADIVTAGNPTMAVRMPNHPLALELIQQAGAPIAAPSANLFGQTSPTTAAHVVNQLGSGWGAVVDGGACRVGIESTVLSLTGDIPVILRPGGASREQIEAIVGPVLEATDLMGATESPGLLDNHYAPITPLIMTDSLAPYQERPDVGFLLLAPVEADLAGPVEILSRTGNLTEGAVNLYAAMRRLDALGLSAIVGRWATNDGLGRGINNRLKKAAVKRDSPPFERGASL